MDWLKTGKSLLKGTADVAFGAASFVGRHQDGISRATSNVIAGGGEVLASAGRQGAQVARRTSSRLQRSADHSDALLGKGAKRAAAWAASGVASGAQLLHAGGELTGKTGPAIGAATGGLVLGGASIASGLIDSVVLGQSDIDALRKELRQHGVRIAEESDALQRRIASAVRRRRRSQLQDMLVVGGMSLAFVRQHPGQVPATIERAYALAYPQLAAEGSFLDAVQNLPADQLPDLASGVKGKLFELELVEHFNAGNLPEGMHAEMALSAIQPGRDIRILDEYGLVADPLQARATECADCVLQTLQRYPGIDVTSISELHARLLALGLAENLRDDGISEDALQAAIEQAGKGAALAFSARDLVPSTLGMAVINLSLLLDRNMRWAEPASRSGLPGTRFDSSAAATKAGWVTTQAWWIGLIAGISSHWLVGTGRARREQYQALLQAAQHLRAQPTAPAGLVPFVG